jgi:hypothetical protein
MIKFNLAPIEKYLRLITASVINITDVDVISYSSTAISNLSCIDIMIDN